jgi:hypothetical protein
VIGEVEMSEQRMVVVYQAGIANVFKVKSFNLADYGRDAERVYQGTFGGAEQLARGAGLMGAIVRSAGCNQAGDIIHAQWSDDFGPFRDSASPLTIN